MNDQIIERLLGPDHPLMPALLWFGAAATLLTGTFAFMKWGWPRLTTAVDLINLLLTLNKRLTEFGEAIEVIPKLEEKLERVRAQVENDHDTNLREEADERHRQIVDAVARVQDDLTGVKKDVGRLDTRDIERGRDIRAITGKVDALLEQANANEDRIDDIEHTIDPRREKR